MSWARYGRRWASRPRAHDYALDAHLDVEEDAVIPLLLALEPEEFVRYYDSPIVTLANPGRL